VTIYAKIIKNMSKALLIVIDGLGIGEAPDAHLYGDTGANTLKSVSNGGIVIPTLEKLGLGAIDGIDFLKKPAKLTTNVYRLLPKSAGKDTTTGHFELSGVVLDKPFPTYPDGFPAELVKKLEHAFGVGILCNKPYSGMGVIEDYGVEHLISGKPIVYTSADSVMQIACHESVFTTSELYNLCRIAREFSDVGRVIARPFAGKTHSFYRLPKRKDFAFPAPQPTILDKLYAKNKQVFTIGKVADIFAGRGVTKNFSAGNNFQVFEQAMFAYNEIKEGLVFANFVDTDMLYGHRNDTAGFKAEVERIDGYINTLLATVKPGDLLLVTADHGCDPETPTTDHTREYVPLIVHGLQPPKNSGTHQGFFKVSQILECFFAL
jgi:phosphopentomutase